MRIYGYVTRWLPSDLVAGITLAAYAIPVSLAYARWPDYRHRSGSMVI